MINRQTVSQIVGYPYQVSSTRSGELERNDARLRLYDDVCGFNAT